MRLEVKNFLYSKQNNVDCMLNSIIASLTVEGIKMTAEEIVLIANGVSFRFFNANDCGEFPVMGLAGISSDFFEKLSYNSQIKISHHSYKDVDDDFNAIYNAISNNHCVIAMADRYELACIISNQLRKKIPENKHMTHHYILIHGIDAVERKLLVCETMLTSRNHDSWIDYDVLDKARICNWLNLDIYRDMYIIEDTSKFCVKPKNEQLIAQIELLISQIEQSIVDMKSFCQEFKTDDNVRKRFIVAITKILRMCINGFDLSGFFYRGYLSEAVSTCLNDTNLINAYRALAESWKSTGLVINKASDYEECCNIWEEVINLAQEELTLHKTTLLFLKQKQILF